MKTTLLLLGLVSFCAHAGATQEIVAVLSSNLKPYEDTLAGLEKSLGYRVQVLRPTEHELIIPAGTRGVVAIGGKAALQKYPRDVALVYCLAPGVILTTADRKAPTAKVYMTPSPSVVIHTLKLLQPEMKNLGILGLTASRDDFDAQIEELGKPMGIEVLVERLGSPAELPDRLRGLKSRIDALWIPPDPHLITPQNFKLIKEFCLANHIAFYVPTVELVEQGATASVAASFDDIGRAAGQRVKDLISGDGKGEKVYPEQPRVAINLKSALESGLEFTPDQLRKADKVIP